MNQILILDEPPTAAFALNGKALVDRRATSRRRCCTTEQR